MATSPAPSACRGKEKIRNGNLKNKTYENQQASHPGIFAPMPHLITIKPLVPLLCVLMLSGCASMPRYSHIQGDDSAELRGQGHAFSLPIKTTVAVDFLSIDGMSAGKAFFFEKPRYASPGKHSIQVVVAHNNISCGATFIMELQPAHRYQFTASLRGKDFELVVYDETIVPKEVVLHALMPRTRKGSLIILPNKQPDQSE